MVGESPNKSKSKKIKIAVTCFILAAALFVSNQRVLGSLAKTQTLKIQTALTNLIGLEKNTKSAKPESIKYNGYCNPRYGFSINFPQSFTIDQESDNGDGCKFFSKDNRASLTVFGVNNVFEDKTDKLYKEALTTISGKVTYKIYKNNWYVISWIDKDIIYYQKTFVGTGSINTFILQYPKTYTKEYSSIVKHISESFKPGNLAEAH